MMHPTSCVHFLMLGVWHLLWEWVMHVLIVYHCYKHAMLYHTQVHMHYSTCRTNTCVYTYLDLERERGISQQSILKVA